MIWIHEKLKKMREEEGFTLIELMVVVLIIAILIAIAIPTFLGARGRAQDRAAQSSARNALTNAKAIYTDDEDYFDANVANLSLAEPSLVFQATGDPSNDPPNEVSVNPGAAANSTRWIGAVKSSNGARCWYVMDETNPATDDAVAPAGGGAGTWWALTTPAVNGCTATGAPPATAGDLGPAVPAAGDWVRQPGDAV